MEVIPSVISKLATATLCTPAGRVPSVATGEDERKLWALLSFPRLK